MAKADELGTASGDKESQGALAQLKYPLVFFGLALTAAEAGFATALVGTSSDTVAMVLAS